MDASDIGTLVLATISVLLIIEIGRRLVNRARYKKMTADIAQMNRATQEARDQFVALVKSGQIDAATRRSTYNPDTDMFDINIATDIFLVMTDLWRSEDDVKVLDNIAQFVRGWVDYLAVYPNKDLMYSLVIILEVFLQEGILPEVEYGNLLFNIRVQQKAIG